MKIQIKHRWTNAVIHQGEYTSMLEAIARAIKDHANLQCANLRGADLRDANLRGADLRYADLRDADLRGANLQCANLRVADLRDADLQGANLRDADLRGADLQDANLRGANLQCANLSESRNTRYSQISFDGHGECGRQLSAIMIDDEWVVFCGCFRGSFSDLETYIQQGEGEFLASRMKAMNVLKMICDINL